MIPTEPSVADLTPLASVRAVMNSMSYTSEPGIVKKFLITRSLWRAPTIILTMSISLIIIGVVVGSISLGFGLLTGADVLLTISAISFGLVVLCCPIAYLGLFWFLIAMLIYTIQDK